MTDPIPIKARRCHGWLNSLISLIVAPLLPACITLPTAPATAWMTPSAPPAMTLRVRKSDPGQTRIGLARAKRPPAETSLARVTPSLSALPVESPDPSHESAFRGSFSPPESGAETVFVKPESLRVEPPQQRVASLAPARKHPKLKLQLLVEEVESLRQPGEIHLRISAKNLGQTLADNAVLRVVPGRGFRVLSDGEDFHETPLGVLVPGRVVTVPLIVRACGTTDLRCEFSLLARQGDSLHEAAWKTLYWTPSQIP